jgi:Kef-type K+ transport system membrane component KefB
MTTSHLILIAILYLAAFVGVAYLTRAKVSRIVGALCGGAVFGLVAVLAVALRENQGWWRMPKAGSSHFSLLLWLSFAVPCAPV